MPRVTPAPPRPARPGGRVLRLHPPAPRRIPSDSVRPLVWALATAASLIGLLSLVAFDAWSRRTPELVARHRPEALCFALARPPQFSPPMRVEPSAALVRGRFGSDTAPAYALREVMSFTDDMVLREETRRVGDFDVTVLWLRLAGGSPDDHWLIVGWMEGADLAVCNFRFEGTGRQLDAEERMWGKLLLERVLTDENFRRDQIPPVRFRTRGASMPVFGPDS